MKLTELEQLLSLPYKGEIELNDIELNDIEELAKYFGVPVEQRTFRQFSTFKRNDMEVTITTSITHGDVPFTSLT